MDFVICLCPLSLGIIILIVLDNNTAVTTTVEEILAPYIREPEFWKIRNIQLLQEASRKSP